MFATLFAGALLGLAAHPDPCAKPLPRGPAVPTALIVNTDCGWFRLKRDGAVTSLGADWLVRHKLSWRPPYGLSLGRGRPGRYVVLRNGRVVWRSKGTYYNEAGTTAFGPNAFAVNSYRRRGVLWTDLKRPEKLVVRGRDAYPIDFTPEGQLLVSTPRAITVVSSVGTVVRRYPYRRATSYSIDQATKTLYFVTPHGMLSAAHGSSFRRIARIRVDGAIGVLGRRLLTFAGTHHVTIVRRSDGSVVARGSWRGPGRQLDAGVAVSDDGRLFAYRVSTSRPGVRRSVADVYVLRAEEGQARLLYHHRMGQAGCGSGGGLSFHGSLLLYRSVDGTGVAEQDLFDNGRSTTRLTPLLRALPRISPNAPGSVYWTTDFRM